MSLSKAAKGEGVGEGACSAVLDGWGAASSLRLNCTKALFNFSFSSACAGPLCPPERSARVSM
jgi:hypothetical protein